MRNINTFLKIISENRLSNINVKITSLLSGFFLATTMSTISTQTGDWSIIAASVIVTLNEVISQLAYSKKKTELNVISLINYIKIGTVYGLFVDAFKLGS